MILVNLFVAAGKAFSAWRRRQRAYAELMALDDHFLADIGIRRSQIRGLIDGDYAIVPPAAVVPRVKGQGLAWRKAV